MLNSTDFIWGVYKNATVPEIRRMNSIAELNQLGINQENWKTEIPLLMCDAYRKGIFHPDKKGDVFFPAYYFFSDWDPNYPFDLIQTNCKN